MDWTFDMDEPITDDTLHAMALARIEVAIRKPGAEPLLAQAERIVTAGQVMIVENAAWVYDQDTAQWRQVYDTNCGHLCPDDPCVHQLAGWLARHIARFESRPGSREAIPTVFGPANATPGTLGGLGPSYRGGRRSHSGSGRRRTCQDCNRCGFYKHGSCNNPNKRAGRGRR